MTRQTTIDLPANANSNYPLSETLGGTGYSAAAGCYIGAITGPILFTAPSSAGANLNVPASGTLLAANSSTGAFDNAIVETSATPGTVRSITGEISNTATDMTSGNLVGVRGAVTVPTGKTVSGGFLYGLQGKMIVAGTISGSAWCPAIFGQLDISAATLGGGQIACLWGDAGATGPSETVANFNMIRLTNTTATTANAMISTYGKASFWMDGQLNGSAWYATSGTSSGSAGDTSKCNAPKVLKGQMDGVPIFIPVFLQNT